MSYYFLLDIAIILLSTKLLGLFTRRIAMPQVVGALLAGLILGPAGFNLLHETDFLVQVSEVGVIILMFSAGLETDISELKKTGTASFLVAVLGVVVPLIGGFLAAAIFNTGTNAMLQNVFIGVILTATSVSITVETLKELGKLSSRSGNIILGAALIDDVLGIIALTVVMGMAQGDVNIWLVMFKIVAFFVLSGVIGYFFHKQFDNWMRKSKIDRRRFSIIAFAFCLIYSFIAEEVFGVADITGAFVAGLMIAKTVRCTYVTHRIDTLGYLFFTPVFFASIGLKAVIPEMNGDIILFSVLIVLIAILSKIIGCGLGAKLCKLPNISALRIGVGMICRGEVALIIATKGVSAGLMKEEFFTPIIIMVIITTIITPILLKIVYKDRGHEIVYAEDPLAERLQNRDHCEV
ncbi:Kef-type K+ transport system membrane component KefB [Breznakia sp. PF5-3]|uniref:cation:proton antiporter n=1 Tax=unclassified Breznakia TaxID=2623764 RepID=UPI002407244E|nr:MULTISPECIES: cation:proton antiporter [unclassified Breznakia]MDL2276664.1 cation:proton antiporter [Breznakia sp. OttesenSCG-928-G09]MDF9825715.1 Kef-type K+ transport system membrane component KefB [Breznakia sp. PM6-1]MDF9836545.1 Kef-type K+ transport system membrane component KefB [Breznakia sp. PF5-3]MDF9838344.1 Kef-type K+ transport system membrane component KefB [Breznakia sp. PFB2-8]MDF9860364.1 Kef-type K+ transport system membrane component KefB [Breznakia sp. PH5-24]